MSFNYLKRHNNRLSIKYNKREEVFNWGVDNAYPSLINSIIDSSVTSKLCADLNAKNLYGKGFEFVDGISDKRLLIVNKRGQYLNQLLRLSAVEFSRQNNLFLHVNYNANFEITSVSILPSTSVRIGKKDSDDYNSKFVVYNNWDSSKHRSIKKEDFQLIDRFNPTKEVIEKQVEAAGGWSKYKGQIIHLTADYSDTYALSDVDSVILDADGEYRSAVYRNKGLTNGFFGSKLFVTKPMDGDGEREDFEKTIENLQGAENSNGILHLEASSATDELDKQFYVSDIESNIDDAKFEFTDESARRNIRMAFGVPAILIDDSDSTLFGNSGELLKTARQMHWDNKEDERQIIQDAFESIFSLWHQPINTTGDWTIKPLISKATELTENPNSTENE